MRFFVRSRDRKPCGADRVGRRQIAEERRDPTGIRRDPGAARKRGMKSRLLDLRNSGDTAGDRMGVVGYGAFAYYEGRNDES